MGMKDKHWQVYLAGRMSGISHSDAIGWRYDVEKLFRNVEKYHGCKFTVINPARYYNFKEVKYQSQREVMDFDLYHVRNSDFIVVNGKDLDKSIGTQIEIYTAWQLKNPVFVFGVEQDPHPWIDRCITRYEKSINNVVEYIEDFYCS